MSLRPADDVDDERMSLAYTAYVPGSGWLIAPVNANSYTAMPRSHSHARCRSRSTAAPWVVTGQSADSSAEISTGPIVVVGAGIVAATVVVTSTIAAGASVEGTATSTVRAAPHPAADIDAVASSAAQRVIFTPTSTRSADRVPQKSGTRR